MTKAIFEKAITRRHVLTGGVASVLAAAAPRRLFGAVVSNTLPLTITNGRQLLQPNLYAFAGTVPDTTAIAATWRDPDAQVAIDRSDSSMIRVHAGSKTWDVEVSRQAAPKIDTHDDIKVFAGDVLSPLGAGAGTVRAVVIELPLRAIGRGAGIWAEYFIQCSRQRIGTPFLANLVAADENLATLYHSSSPAEDRERLTDPLARAIAARLRAHGFSSDIGSHSHRLAATLLPDVLHYDAGRPAGFTFAAQNGRHPSESSDEMVNAILNGGVPSASRVQSTQHRVETFPYFKQSTAAV
jgi:hypothetical protein